MAVSQNMQSKQKLSDDEKTTLINFYKENKAFWSSEVNFQNKEEKSAVKEQLLTLFEGKYSEGFLDKNFHAFHTAFSREHKKYKGNPSKKKRKFYDQLSFLTEELEKEKKKTFDLAEKEILIDFFQSGHFMNMVNVSNNETPLNQPSNAKISASPNNQFDPFSPASTC